MDKVEELISEKEIIKKVEEIGNQINKDFHNDEVMIVSVLKGSFIFTADLVRFLNFPVEVAFIAASSYGASTVSSGELKIRYDIDIPVKNKNSLLTDNVCQFPKLIHIIVRFRHEFLVI